MLRARLREHVKRVRAGHPSPIVPVVLGDEARALAASAALLERGLLVPAIRPPTVAPGTSRLRVALSAAHTDAQVDPTAWSPTDLGRPHAARGCRGPERVVVVAGTATEVGKTFVGADLLGRLRATGKRVAARKPAQSFAPGDLRTDADVLAAATDEDPTAVCPRHRWYETPMAPPMAAEALLRPAFTVDDLVTELDWSAAVDVGLVETVGGVRSPIAHDGDCASLVLALGPDLVVLVADAGLGTINAVRLAAGALAPLPVVVLLNRFDGADELHERNRRWLAERDGYEVVTTVGALAERVHSSSTRVDQQAPPA